jgi:hypothetical protein
MIISLQINFIKMSDFLINYSVTVEEVIPSDFDWMVSCQNLWDTLLWDCIGSWAGTQDLDMHDTSYYFRP